MNKKLLSLLLALCLAGAQVDALPTGQKVGLLGLNVMKIGKDAFFGVDTDSVEYIPVEDVGAAALVALPQTKDSNDEDDADGKNDEDDADGKKAATFSQELSAQLTKLSTRRRLNTSHNINQYSLANLMLSMTLSSLTAKAIQYSPREISLLKTAGFSAAGAFAINLMFLILEKTNKVDFFKKHENVNLGRTFLLLISAAISYVVAQNPELTAAAIAEIKEKGFVTASGEFFENAIKNYSKDGSRRDRIAFVVKNVLPFIIFNRNIPATDFSRLIVGAAYASELPDGQGY